MTNCVSPVALLSFVPTIVGGLMTFAGIWVSAGPAPAAIITIGALLLFGSSIVAGLRRRQADTDAPVDPAEAWQTYRTLRLGAIFTALMAPVICVLVLAYIDTTLGAALLVGGIVISSIGGIPAERKFLANMRDRAQSA